MPVEGIDLKISRLGNWGIDNLNDITPVEIRSFHGRVARPEHRDGRGERGENVEYQTTLDTFTKMKTTPFEYSGRATQREDASIDCSHSSEPVEHVGADCDLVVVGEVVEDAVGAGGDAAADTGEVDA